MRTVDLVRYGSCAIRNPVVGELYAQLVHDWLVGKTRTDREYAALCGVTTTTVTRTWQLLEYWGLITRMGGTRARRIVLMPMPNRKFCEDVVVGMYGQEALESVALGNPAELCPSEGPSDPVVNYAVQQLLGLYGEADCVSYGFPEPDVRTGTGSVVHADLGTSDYNQLSFKAVAVCSYTNYTHVLLTRDLITIGATEIATYPVNLPSGLKIDRKYSTPKQRAARNRKYVLPDNSFAMLYWPMEKIKDVDVEYYDTIENLVTYWNTVFSHQEKLDRKIYTRFRYLLVEQEISEEKIRDAIKAASIDKFWSQHAVLSSLINDAGRMRKLSTQNTHDRLGRGFNAIPRGEVVAVEF